MHATHCYHVDYFLGQVFYFQKFDFPIIANKYNELPFVTNRRLFNNYDFVVNLNCRRSKFVACFELLPPFASR